MKHNNLFHKILSLTIPAVVTNVTTPLLSLCDIAIAGHMGNPAFIAAIAVGGTIFNMLYWLCGFLRMGSSGTTAQAYGAGNRAQEFAILQRGLLLAFFIGFAFIALQQSIVSGFMQFIEADSNTQIMATRYFNICIWGAPAVLATYVLTGWFIGMQNSKAPMWVSIFINILNITTSFTLVYLFNLKIEGVAIGTLSAQWCGLLIAIIIGLKKYGWERIGISKILNSEEIVSYFRINTDIFLRTLCLVTVTLWFTKTGAMQGTVMLAVNALLMQLFTIFSYIMDGVAFAAEALCGRYLGEQNHTMLNRTIRMLFKLGLIISAIFTAAYITGGNLFLQILSSDIEVINHANDYFVWATAIPIISFAAFVWDGIMIGTTSTRAMLASMLGGALIFFICRLTLFSVIGNHGLWIAFLSYLLTRGIILTYIGRHYLYSAK